jgi:PBP1b-binding outer membrane lipoprotein LpoB
MKCTTILLLALLMLGCNQTAEKEVTTNELPPQTDTMVVQKEVEVFNPDSKLYIWKATPDYKKIKNTDIPAGLLNADSLIKGLNEQYENIFLEKIKISGDTIYTKIKNASYLTDQMGSTGAEIYVADVVLNLTAVPGIKYVNIDLLEGSHMEPGVWSLDNFKKYTEVK